ncbi:MAG TPA: sigma-70 family RNA polymerase sigma factor [Steroidobacteraceae bacterium]|nr:sigma-70 family RNA polymerase sigma factor [Steroidobacteraceae bacterium]
MDDPSTGPGDITKLLNAADGGDALAASRLYELVYSELKLLAAANMRREATGHTLQPTALVNEAYLRLRPAEVTWANRRHFFGAAAEAMRRILVDHARRKHAQKRGDGLERVTLSDVDVAAEDAGIDVLALDEALTALHAEDPRLAQVVTLRYFAGMGIEQVAEALELSPATVKRDWTFARAWLHDYMTAHR